MIRFAIGVYFLICLVGFYMGYSIEASNGSQSAISKAEILFWILAFMVETVQEGIQALSRSYFNKPIPPSRSNEFFGFFDIFGKFATVVGYFLVSIVTFFTERSSFGILSLLILFATGAFILILGKIKMRQSEEDILKENNTL